jgi:dihydroxyacetone kinase-like protein
MRLFAENIGKAEQELTDLDLAIGDGDHGVNMRRGMDAVTGLLEDLESPNPSGQLRAISMTLISSVGGASGPLYGTFFLHSSHLTLHRPDLGLADLTAAVEAGYRGVVQLGKASVGDKTMVDALAAAVNSLRASGAHREPLPEALVACSRAARRAAEDTIPMIARKGRASYLGERSIGCQDPGATSASLLFESLAQVFEPLSTASSSNRSNPPTSVLLL